MFEISLCILAVVSAIGTTACFCVCVFSSRLSRKEEGNKNNEL